MNLKINDSSTAPRTQNTNAPASSLSLGDQLRQAREANNISLRSISDQTRIAMRHLEAIETGDYKQLPGGIFNRSFVKAYAKQVGFDENVALELYSRAARAQGETDDTDAPVSYRPQVYTNGEGSRSSKLTALFSIIILAIICYGVYAAQHWYSKRNSQNAAAATTNDAATTQPANTVPQVQPTPAPPTLGANEPLIARLAATNEDVAVTVFTDDDNRGQAFTLRANEQPREFIARQRLRLRYARARASSLAVELNGHAARVPIDGASNTNEMLISRDTFEQLTR